MHLNDRLEFSIDIARRAGDFAKAHFQAIDALKIESKGHQDLVSNADKDTESLIREAIAERWPDDGIVGEEYGRKRGSTAFNWVIDPIDGTANFVRGIPQWCVVIACVLDGEAVIGIINDPSSGELFQATRGSGAFCNGQPIRASSAATLSDGSVGIGFSGRAPAKNIVKAIDTLVDSGGVFFRNGSGALMLAYAAGGRLLGYVEEHMNAWDCIAGLLIVEEAGGQIVKPDPATVLDAGTVVIAGGSKVFPAILKIAQNSFNI